jgi:outer membrane lipoprotein-sorting protein
MMRITMGLMAAAFFAGSLVSASAQAPAPAAPAKMKLTKQSLKDMKAKWSANKGKLKACRKDVKVKGLAGDDRWFYIEDCMAKS